MYDSRIDWKKPGRDYIDPEFENLLASSLIEVRHPHRYAHVASEVGIAGIIAGALLVLLSVFGSTAWTPVLAFVNGPSLLTLAVLGVTLALVGAVSAVIARLWLIYAH